MTTWELATEHDVQQIRLLLEKLRRSGRTPQVTDEDLAGLTKKNAGTLHTQLREMLNDPDPP